MLPECLALCMIASPEGKNVVENPPWEQADGKTRTPASRKPEESNNNINDDSKSYSV